MTKHRHLKDLEDRLAECVALSGLRILRAKLQSKKWWELRNARAKNPFPRAKISS